jgi:Bacterial Ig-like domain/WD40-like Beta Propeller Repeat
VLAIGAAVLAPILYYASTVDLRPPQVNRFVLTQHLAGDDGVALTTSSLEVVFSEPVDHPSAQSAFSVTPKVSGSFSWSGATMVFTPADRLPLETSFSVRLRGQIRDLAGNVANGAGPYGFRTVGGPVIAGTQPADHATDVPLDASIQLTFSTFMDTTSVQRALEVTPQTAFDLRWSGQRLSIVPRAPLLPGKEYLVVLGSTARDQAGTTLPTQLRLSFNTVSAELSARTVVPADGTQGIAVTSPIAVIFDRAIDPDTVNDNLLTVTPRVSGSVSLSAPEGAAGLQDIAQRVLRFTPSGSLPANSTFIVSLGTGIRGADGSRIASPLSWTFTTGAPSSSLGNQIVFLSQRSGVANVWAMNPDGSNPHQVSAELSPLSSYAVAPDGRSLVVGDGARLVELRADGSGRRILTDSGLVEFDPSYAPDGSAIAFGRADARTGSGLGIWRRPPGGGGAERVTPSPTQTIPAPSESPSPSGGPPHAPLLRSPSYSPDGNRMAFVDMSGFADIIDLRSGAISRAPFRVVAPPAWLPDGSAVLISGLEVADGAQDGQPTGLLSPGTAVSPFTPTDLGLSSSERGSLQIGELGVGGATVSLSQLRQGATLPDVDADGRVAYLVLDSRLPDAGRAWTAAGTIFPSNEVVPDERALETSVRFAPLSQTLLVAREALPGAPSPQPSPTATATPTPGPVPTSPVPATGAGGIWLLNLASGTRTQLSPDGWLPTWLP